MATVIAILQVPLTPALSSRTPWRENVCTSSARRRAHGPRLVEDDPGSVVYESWEQKLEPRYFQHPTASVGGSGPAVAPLPTVAALHKPGSPPPRLLAASPPEQRYSGYPGSNLTVSNCREEWRTALCIGHELQQPGIWLVPDSGAGLWTQPGEAGIR